jgi:hypothetical protein
MEHHHSAHDKLHVKQVKGECNGVLDINYALHNGALGGSRNMAPGILKLDIKWQMKVHVLDALAEGYSLK